MSFRGYRKFTAFVLVLIAFTLILVIRPLINPFDLGLALSFILGAFSGANAITHFADKGKKDG